MKDIRVVVKILTYPLLSGKPPESTMFPVKRISLLIQQHHTSQVPASHMQTCTASINLQFLWWWGHLSSWQSITFQHSTIAEPHRFSTPASFQVHPNHMWWPRWWRRRRGLPTVSLEDDHWTMEEIPDRHLWYMNIQYIKNCVNTPAHIWIIHIHHTMIPWILVTFPSLKISWLHPVMKKFLP